MDYPYVLNFLLMLILAYLYWQKPSKRIVNIAIILQFIFIAFRAPVVGADTWNYVRYLAGERNFYNYDSRSLEKAFLMYREVLLFFHCNRFTCMIINSFLACYPLYLFMKRYSYNIPMSLAMLSVVNFYYLYFCGLRQILALAILFMALLYVLDNKKRKWMVFAFSSVLAWFFHTTAAIYVVIILVAYVVRFRSTNVLIFAVVLSAALGIIFQSFNVFGTFNFFLSLNVDVTERLNNYLLSDETRELTSIIKSLRPSIVAIGVFYFMDRNKQNHIVTNLYAAGVILGNLFVSVPMIGRLIWGLTWFGAIAITWTMGNYYHSSLKQRKIVNVFLVLFFLYFGQSIIKDNQNSNIDFMSSGRMHPYYFIWEDYRDHPSIKYFE